MANPFPIELKGKEYQVYIFSLEAPPNSPADQFGVWVDDEKAHFDFYIYKQNGLIDNTGTDGTVDLELKRNIIHKLVNEPEYKNRDYPPFNRSKLPVVDDKAFN